MNEEKPMKIEGKVYWIRTTAKSDSCQNCSLSEASFNCVSYCKALEALLRGVGEKAYISVYFEEVKE